MSKSGCEETIDGSMDSFGFIYGQVLFCCSFILAAYCGHEPCSEHGPFGKNVRSRVSSCIH